MIEGGAPSARGRLWRAFVPCREPSRCPRWAEVCPPAVSAEEPASLLACSAYVFLHADAIAGVPYYFPRSGHLVLTSTTDRLLGTLTDVQFDEFVRGADNTFVPAETCVFDLSSLSFDDELIPTI